VSFGTLALLIAAGLVGPALTALGRGEVPVVVGELAAGVVIGVTGFGWIDVSDPTTAFLARMGFAMLMFVAGTHVPLRSTALRPSLRRGAVAAVVTAIVATPAAIGIAALTGVDRPALLALPLATSSAALVLPLLHERGVGDDVLVAVAWVTIADVATILALPVALATGNPVRVALGSVAVTALALAIWLVARRLRDNPAVVGLRRRSKALEWALDLRLSLLALAALSYTADRVGTSILVAGFSAGLIVGGVGEPRRLTRQVRGLAQGFLVPLFFVVLGARIDLRSLFTDAANLALVALLVAASIAAHGLGALAIRSPLAVGLVASAALGVPAAVVEIGLNGGLITPGQGAAITTAALLSIAVATIGAGRTGAPQRPVVPPAAGIDHPLA
jgi:Kef-type K+ transport system membrane component KefB